MKSLLAGVRRQLRHVLSMRGAIITGAAVSAILAILLSGAPARIAAAASVGLVAVLLLLISSRQAASWRRANTIDKRLRRVESRVEKLRHAPSGRSAGLDSSFDMVARLDGARRAIAAVRGQLADGGPPEPSVSAPSQERGGAEDALVTVVIPCFNDMRFVAAAMESVRRQSYPHWECIVIDDASTDGSLREIWRAASRDPRFRVVRHKVNGGLSAARNTGLRSAEGRFVTFLDADDLLLEDALLVRLEELAAHQADPTVAGTFCGVRLAPEDVELDGLPASIDWSPPAFHDFVSAKGECPFNAHAPLLRTEVVRAIGGFDESFRDGAEDWDLWLRMMRNGYQFRPAASIAAIYRQKRSSMARSKSARHVAISEQLIASAYQAADPSHLRAPLPTAMVRPLQDYERLITTAKRTIRFAAMALSSGDRDAARETIAMLPSASIDLLQRHLNLDVLVSDGFRRTLGLSPREIKHLSDELGPFRAEILRLIEQRAGGLPEPPPTADAPHVDLLLVPQGAHQASAMLDVARQVAARRSLTIGFLDVERESGAQGSGSVIESAGLPVWSLNEWILAGGKTSFVVVALPRDAAVEAVAAAAAAASAEVLELALPYEEVLRVDDAVYHAPTERLTAESVIERLVSAATDSGAAFDEPRRLGPLLWVPSGSDPDSAWQQEEYPSTEVDAVGLAAFKDMHRGERVVIIGNGPSINDQDLSLLADEFTFGVNGIFYASDRMKFDPTYYVVEDTAVMADNLEEIRRYAAGHKFFPSIYRDQVGEAPNVSYFMMNRGFYSPASPAYCVPRFSTDITQRVYCGQSVTIINLQLAYYMGFAEVVLIGMDFSYVVPEDAKVEGNIITSMGDDPNHFHPDYFGRGKKWKDPKLDRVLANYALAKVMYEADGRRIVNATAGGKLELFDRVSFDDLFDRSR